MVSIQSTFNAALGSVASIAGKFGKAQNIPTASSPEAQAAATSMQKTQAVQEIKTKQRRNFKDYMMEEQTSFGKFKDLAPSVQKAIMQQYSKTERKKIMDERDKVNG